MKSVIFKDILIADIERHTARYVTFDSGLNVVTSNDNHIVKSLYHTLGADVEFDRPWDLSSKIMAVRMSVDDKVYRIVRQGGSLAVFDEGQLVLLTNSVTKKLAPKLAEIYDFSIYLTEKSDDKKVVLAPPAFTYMPYYIDQDKGWSGLYESFQRINQFEKRERIKSLYFHLGLYDKNTVEQMSERDRLKDELLILKEKENNLRITVNALLGEMQNLVSADNIEDLETRLNDSNDTIASLVESAGKARNKVQELQTALQEHEFYLSELRSHKSSSDDNAKSHHVCPQCGYMFDDEIYSLVRDSYNQVNEEYLLNQVEMIVESLRSEVKESEQEYLTLMNRLREQEKAFDESQNASEEYVRNRGLQGIAKKYQDELANIIIQQRDKELAIKRINSSLKKIKGKKEVEDLYIDYVQKNILKLRAWDPAFEGKIKLLSPLKGQGSLVGKMILAQHVALFQTMHSMEKQVIWFPFVVDSPRQNEASYLSSQEILTMITGIDSYTQVILATVDYDQFQLHDKANVIHLNEAKNLLNTETYESMKQDIEDLYRLLLNASV